MKIFPLVIASLSVLGVVPANASGGYMVDPSGRQIEMNFCGISSARLGQPSRSPLPTEPEWEQPEPEISIGARGHSVTSENWIELKTFVARQKDGIPVTLGDVQSIMGFDGELTKTQADGTQQWEWVDQNNPKIKVVVIFADGEMKSMKGTVY
jgi:hypothetical protein